MKLAFIVLLFVGCATAPKIPPIGDSIYGIDLRYGYPVKNDGVTFVFSKYVNGILCYNRFHTDKHHNIISFEHRLKTDDLDVWSSGLCD